MSGLLGAEKVVVAVVDEPKPGVELGARLRRFDAWTDRVSDYFNPILVKECRQAIKSKQFLFTFCAMLFAAWMWTLMGLSNWMGTAFRTPSLGPTMLIGYMLILLAPLIVIVPFSAFRSLISEREDGTFELTSITTLSPHQIVAGKFGSAALQIVMYLCAIAPCLALTYMLRGVDLPTIVLAIAYSSLVSALASVAGLAVATFAREKHWQLLLSVAVLVGLIVLLISSFGLTASYAFWLNPNADDLWTANSILLTFYISYFAIFWVVAVSQLAPVGANRSTAVRWALLGPQFLIAAWLGAWLWQRPVSAQGDELQIILNLSWLHWWAAGTFLAVEHGTLTSRTRRDLPQTALGRMFLTWFNPGSASGYFFTLATYFGVVLTSSILFQMTSGRVSHNYDYVACGLVLLAYLTIYLGVARLVVTWLRFSFSARWFTSLLIQVTMVVFGVVLAELYFGSRSIVNVFNILDYNATSSLGNEVFGVALVAIVVFALNLRDIVVATRYERAPLPQRLLAEQRAERLREQAVERRSPWSEV